MFIGKSMNVLTSTGLAKTCCIDGRCSGSRFNRLLTRSLISSLYLLVIIGGTAPVNIFFTNAGKF